MAHPNRHLAGWQGILQADAYGGYNDLYRGDRVPGPVLSALCWSHARRKFFELADIKRNARQKKPAHDISPVALEAVKKIDAIFDIERQINGLDVASRLEARHRLVRPLVEDPMRPDFSPNNHPELPSNIINEIGVPVVTVPFAYYEDGTPFVLALIGDMWTEADLLAYAYDFEQATTARIPPKLTARARR